MDPAKPAVQAAVGTLLAELADIFPDEFFHFGGDEAVGLDSAVQAAFHRQVAQRLRQLGKRPIGWDACLHPDLTPSTVVQVAPVPCAAGRSFAVDAQGD